jgi:hypothetical protein
MNNEKLAKEFLLIFRMDITTKEAQPTPEQMEMYMIQWEEWVSGIARKEKLAGGNHLSIEGKVLKPKGQIMDGPYTKNKDSVAGYIIVKAANLDEAAILAKDCPILNGEGTSVEVREIAGM